MLWDVEVGSSSEAVGELEVVSIVNSTSETFSLESPRRAFMKLLATDPAY